jgi:GNAT superfamily N-acetyltransferase
MPSRVKVAADKSAIETYPLNSDRWRDLAALFETSSTTRTCWCMWFRETTAEFRANRGEKNRRAFQRVVRTAGAPPGVLAYIDGKPAGWCAIAPRSDYTRLARSKTLRPIDDKPVWSITCFFIAAHARRRGVAHALLRAAVDLAAKHGAPIVEGYPLVPGRKLRSDEAYVGVTTLFEKAGFAEAARPSPSRTVMRRTISRRKTRRHDARRS